jgi:Protein of unknown function (DUF1360)
MPEVYGTIVVLSLAVATVAMTLTKAKISQVPRDFIGSKNAWVKELVNCPYCTGHWLSFLAVIVYQPRAVHSGQPIVDVAVSAFVIVALSTFWCGLIYTALSNIGFLYNASDLAFINKYANSTADFGASKSLEEPSKLGSNKSRNNFQQ